MSVRRKICVGAGNVDDKGSSSAECRHWIRRSPTWLLRTANDEETELGTRLETKSTLETILFQITARNTCAHEKSDLRAGE